MHGIISAVYTIDSTSENKGIPYGVFTLYDIRVAPSGQLLRNVPTMMEGGHYTTVDSTVWERLPNYAGIPNVSSPLDSIQNVEETPYVINQPVIVMFLGNNEGNPIIIGPAPCASSGSGQTTADYPKKYGSFQGASWSIDKNGAVELDVPTSQDLTIKIAGNTLCYITNGTVHLGGAGAGDTSILGPALVSYLNSTLTGWLDLHTHTSAAPGSPTSTPITYPAPTASSIETTVVKVL
jgi:hypothetical protein